AGGVYDVQRYALYVDLLHDFVAGGAGDVGNDGYVLAGQGVEQAGLADVGLPGRYDVQAFAQDHALAGLGDQIGQFGPDAVQAGAGLVFFQEVDFFFRKVQGGFDQGAQLYDAFGQGVYAGRERAAERGHGAAGGGFGR